MVTDPPPRDTASGTNSLHGLLLLSKRRIKKFWLHDIVYPSGAPTLSDRGFLIAQVNKPSMTPCSIYKKKNQFNSIDLTAQTYAFSNDAQYPL